MNYERMNAYVASKFILHPSDFILAVHAPAARVQRLFRHVRCLLQPAIPFFQRTILTTL
jgi:hypothetical protein